MDLSKAPLSQRYHIGFFGCVNAGKSSLANAFCNQNISIVSDTKGTTTDAVKKTMELLPWGPVAVFDTAGYDDVSEIGNLRIEKTKEIISKTDIAILVIDAKKGITPKDRELIELFKNIPYIIAYNKSDLIEKQKPTNENEIYVSAKNKENIHELKELVGKHISKIKETKEKSIVADRLKQKDNVILVIPIDESAPKGRLILPQQLVLRELLDNHMSAICTQVEELESLLKNIKPNLVITDSQAFGEVKKIVPDNIPLTSFSILFANYKGELKTFVEGAKKISDLKDGSNILISEGCTHHRQCNDIGTVKFPKWLKDFTGKNINFEFSSGGEFPKDLNKFDLIIHCGGCMLTEKEVKSRIKNAIDNKINIVNYGIAIAYMNGILKRSLEIFPEISSLLEI